MNVRVVHVCVWNFIIVDVVISDLGIQTMFINVSIQTAIMPQHWLLINYEDVSVKRTFA